MRNDLLINLAELVAGKPAQDVVSLLIGKTNVNEFALAKKLDLTINQTRNLLYRLANSGLVSFTRRKDKRKGWYTYFWTLNVLKCLEIAEKNVSKEISQTKSQLKSRQKKNFYFCNSCQIEVSEENALLNQFVCSECGGVYELKEDSELIKQLNNNLIKLNSELESINSELSIERGKIEKKRLKVEKQEKEKKRVERERKKKLKMKEAGIKFKKPKSKVVVDKKLSRILKIKSKISKRDIKKPAKIKSSKVKTGKKKL